LQKFVNRPRYFSTSLRKNARGLVQGDGASGISEALPLPDDGRLDRKSDVCSSDLVAKVRQSTAVLLHLAPQECERSGAGRRRVGDIRGLATAG